MAKGSITRTTVAPHASVTRFRAVPGAGEVLVREGASVDAADVVARMEQPGEVHVLDVAAQLGLPRARAVESLAVRVADAVSEGQVLAKSHALFGLWRSQVVSPVDGAVESVSGVTGQIVVRGRPAIVDVRAFVSGVVSRVAPGAGVEIRATASLLQGILGLGGEAMGPLALGDGTIDERHRGGVVATRGRITLEAMRRAREMGVAALVGASAFGEDLVQLLGASPNLAAAGGEKIGFALLLTEGLGELPMAPRAAALLEKLDGMRVAVNGATQVRAGVIRPDLLGPPLEGAPLDEGMEDTPLGVGARVRIVRGGRFGQEGAIIGAPDGPARLESGASSLVYDIQLDDGSRARVPRQNVEPEG